MTNVGVPKYFAEFERGVNNGEIIVNKFILMEINRVRKLIKDKRYYYDGSVMDGFIKFCENEMCLTNGDPIKLTLSFKVWAEQLLCWFYFTKSITYDKKNGKKHSIVKHRLTNKQYLIVARGAAKTMYIALIQAYCLILDRSTTAQIVVAPTMRQSLETLIPIQTAIARARGPLLKFMTTGNIRATSGKSFKRCIIASTKKGVENFLTNSIIQIIPMSIDKIQSLRPAVASIDEWLSGDVNEDVIGAIEQGASKVEDYIILAVSSEGTTRNGVGDGIKMELEKILRQEYEAPYVSIWYYRLDSIDEVADPSLWEKANPNLGITVSYQSYERDVKRAEQIPSYRNDMLAKRFGIPLAGSTYFFTYEETLCTCNNTSYDGMECVLGIDLSQGDDFCAFTFLFALNDYHFGVKTRCYVTEKSKYKQHTALQLKYGEFEAEGSLVVMTRPLTDIREVFEDLEEFISEHNYDVEGIGYDPYNFQDFYRLWSENNGEYNMIKVQQGARTESVPIGELKALTEQRRLMFDQEIMSFCMGNAIVIEDTNGNRKLSKMRADRKIDSVAALIDAWVVYKRVIE